MQEIPDQVGDDIRYIHTPMKITLLTVGKTDRDWVKQGLDIYVSRLKHYIPFSIVEIPELKNVSALTKEQITIAASKSPVFKAGKAFKDAIK